MSVRFDLEDGSIFYIGVGFGANNVPYLNLNTPADLDPTSPIEWFIPGLIDSVYKPTPTWNCDSKICGFIGELGDSGVTKMKRGRTVRVTYRTLAGIPRIFETSLKGFTVAYDGPPEEPSVEQVLQAEAEKLRAKLDAAAETTPSDVEAAIDGAQGQPEVEAPPSTSDEATVDLVEGVPVDEIWAKACRSLESGDRICTTLAAFKSVSATFGMVEDARLNAPYIAVEASDSNGRDFVLSIDDHPPLSFPFSKCDKALCATQAKVPANWFGWLAAGKSLTIKYAGTDGGAMSGTVDLRGYSAAYTEVDTPPPAELDAKQVPYSSPFPYATQNWELFCNPTMVKDRCTMDSWAVSENGKMVLISLTWHSTDKDIFIEISLPDDYDEMGATGQVDDSKEFLFSGGARCEDRPCSASTVTAGMEWLAQSILTVKFHSNDGLKDSAKFRVGESLPLLAFDYPARSFDERPGYEAVRDVEAAPYR